MAVMYTENHVSDLKVTDTIETFFTFKINTSLEIGMSNKPDTQMKQSQLNYNLIKIEHVDG